MNDPKKLKTIVKWYLDTCELDKNPSRKEIIRKLTRLNLPEEDYDFAIGQLKLEREFIEDQRAKIKTTRNNAIIGFLLVAPSLFMYTHLQEITKDAIKWELIFLVGAAISFIGGLSGLVKVKKINKKIAERHLLWPTIFNNNPCLKGHVIKAIYPSSNTNENALISTNKGTFELVSGSVHHLKTAPSQIKALAIASITGKIIADIKVYYDLYLIQLEDDTCLLYESMITTNNHWTENQFQLISAEEFMNIVSRWENNDKLVSLCNFEYTGD